MNNQKPEPPRKGDGELLDFHSMFFTVQGEGPFSGHRAVFVRLAGCNLQCPGCDTEYTEGRTEWYYRRIGIEAKQLAESNNAAKCLIVITGGEPLRQSIGPLVRWFEDHGHPVQIESNGVLGPDLVLEEALLYSDKVKLVVSPKTTRINPKTRKLAYCFKYVLDYRSVDPNDGLPIKALEHPASTGVARPEPGKPVYLNPYDAQDAEHNKLNLRAAANSCMTFGYTLGVQLHKLVGLE